MAIPSHHHKKPDLARLMSSTWVPNPHQATRPRWLTWPNLPARIPSPARWREPHAAPADLARNEAEILSTWPAVTAPPPPPLPRHVARQNERGPGHGQRRTTPGLRGPSDGRGRGVGGPGAWKSGGMTWGWPRDLFALLSGWASRDSASKERTTWVT